MERGVIRQKKGSGCHLSNQLLLALPHPSTAPDFGGQKNQRHVCVCPEMGIDVFYRSSKKMPEKKRMSVCTWTQPSSYTTANTHICMHTYLQTHLLMHFYAHESVDTHLGLYARLHTLAGT